MKTNKDLADRGRLIGSPGGKYYKTWAQYYVRFLQAYRNQSIELWGLTTGNEPINGLIPRFPFNCMSFTPWSQRDFLKKDLGPALRAAGFADTKILILDDQRYLLPLWAKVVLDDPQAAQHASGIAFHWYGNKYAPPQLLDLTHRMFPDKILLSSEATIMGSPKLGEWSDGEAYAEDILTDLKHWTTGWVDWNYALDLEGGPSWAKNFCSAPIIVNKTAGEFYKQPTFYALAHFARFLPPNSQRISTQLKSSECTWKMACTSPVLEAGFVTPDGSRVLVLINKSDQSHKLAVHDTQSDAHFTAEIAGRTLLTFVW